MKTWEKWTLHLLTLGVTASGVVYFWMKYLLDSDDPFSLINHPMQPAMLDAHLLFSPLLVFLLGMIVRSHIAGKLRNGTRSGRRSGLLLLGLFAVMTLSGYSLQIVASPVLQDAIWFSHLSSGAGFFLIYLVHAILSVSKRASRAASPTSILEKAPLGSGSVILAASLGLFPLASESLQAQDVVVVREVYLMGTRCKLSGWAADRDAGLKGLEALLQSLEASERQLSTWRPDSELSRLNGSPLGGSFPLSESLCLLLPRVRDWTRSTGGAFDPAIGPLVEAWQLRSGGSFPDPDTLTAAQGSSGIAGLFLSPGDCRAVRLSPVWLDAGGFGKGEALERALQVSTPQLSAWMIDLGGQIVVSGHPPGSVSWILDIASAAHRDRTAFSLQIEGGSVSVSGGSQRDLKVEDRRVGHILDPRSGHPAPYQGAVVVWREGPLEADILSTALLVMGRVEGLAWAQREGVAVCFLELAEGDGKTSENLDCDGLKPLSLWKGKVPMGGATPPGAATIPRPVGPQEATRPKSALEKSAPHATKSHVPLDLPQLWALHDRTPLQAALPRMPLHGNLKRSGAAQLGGRASDSGERADSREDGGSPPRCPVSKSDETTRPSPISEV